MKTLRLIMIMIMLALVTITACNSTPVEQPTDTPEVHSEKTPEGILNLEMETAIEDLNKVE